MGSEPTVTIVPDPDPLADAAARLTVDVAPHAIAARGRFMWALAGGEGPRPGRPPRRACPRPAGRPWGVPGGRRRARGPAVGPAAPGAHPAGLQRRRPGRLPRPGRREGEGGQGGPRGARDTAGRDGAAG